MAYERCGSYVLLRELGLDPLGPTYRAGHVTGQSIDRLVLLRRLAIPGLDAAALARTVAERRDLPRRTRSPFLADLVEAGSCAGQPFLAYDYQPGLTAARLLAVADEKLTPLPPDLAAVIADRAAQALIALHAVELGHGLLVPQLLWVSSEGEVRLLGSEAGPVLRSAARRSGPFAPFLSPEARAGERPRESDDVWSLGALLAALLTGSAPESPDDDGKWLATARLPEDDTPLPEPLAELLHRTLAPRPRRLARVEAWHQALGRALELVGWRTAPFQLAVYMHNLLKSEFAREPKEVEQEREEALRPAPAPAPAAAPASAHALPSPPPGSRPPAAPPAGPRLLSALGNDGDEGPGRRSWLPLGIAAGVLLLGGAGLFLVVDRSQETQSARAAESAPEGGPAPAASPANAEGATQEPPADPVASPLPAPTPPAALEQRLAALMAERQRSLDQRYSQEIEQLRAQLAETRRATPERVVPAAPAPAPPPTLAAPQGEREGGGASGGSPSREAAPATVPSAPAVDVRPAPAATTATPPSAPLVPPKLLRFEPPDYPAIARRKGVQGTVILALHVSPRGEVTEVRFVRRVSQDVGINEAAEAAARRARFAPATRGGQPVDAWYTLTIPFQL